MPLILEVTFVGPFITRLDAGDPIVLLTRATSAASSCLERRKGIVQRYEYAVQTMNDVPYAKWREYDPEDTVRFHALRLQEAGTIQSTPQQIIAQGTD